MRSWSGWCVFLDWSEKTGMIYKADLHTHSTASDGQYAPAELAKLVKERGAQVWALTDHDNLDGLVEAAAAGEALDLRVVRGVELSSEDYPNLHILGYDFSVPMLRDWIESQKKRRDDRKYRIRDHLRTKGLEIPLDEVDQEAAGGSVGRPHFAKVMLRHGYVATRREAFDRYLDTPEQTTEYLALAEKYSLHITGGSDFHGEKNKPDHPLAAWELELDWLL